MGDITLRAIEILKEVHTIACEDTRHSGRLLLHFGIKKPLLSLYQAQEVRKTAQALVLLKDGKTVALISDCGTPNIQDPGYRLVEACVAEGIPIYSVPGPSAIIAALSISGLPTNAFIFDGFLPPKSGGRKTKMQAWLGEKRTVIFYESPHKIIKTLNQMLEVFGDIHVVLARELTKKFEEVLRKPLSQHIEHFSTKNPKGEFVVLFNLAHQ